MMDENLRDLIDKYGGKNSLIPLGYFKQVMFYAKHGVQPKFVYENEIKPRYLTCWYLKSDITEVKAMWDKTNPKNI